jgi:alpha-beta hydrolase superfamily lysophospholipase
MSGSPSACEFLPRPDGERIAYCRIAGAAPGILWLGGFKADMGGTKAAHLAGWAALQGLAYTAFDHYGHGRSSGVFAEGTIGRYRQDALAILDEITPGPQLLVGSSMGGWIALLVALARPERIAGLVLIAPATDFTEDLIWAQASPEIRREILENGVWYRPSTYDPEPYPITRQLIEEARAHLLLRGRIALSAPVHILHGTKDEDIPIERSLLLADRLASPDVIVESIELGDHRLSRPADLGRLEAAVGRLALRGK